MASATQPTQAQSPASFLTSSIMNAGTGALSAWAFTTINPVAGALFGVTSTWGSRLVQAINNSLQCTNDTAIGKIGAYVINLIGGISLAVLATTLMGFSLTFTASLILTAAWVFTGIALSLIEYACVNFCVVPSSAFGRLPLDRQQK